MKFLSIKEYFYKLNTIGFILLLPPLLALIFLYYWFEYHPPLMTNSESKFVLLQIAIVASLLILTSVYWVGRIRMNRLRKLIELARKMDGYHALTLLKMAGYCACSLLMATGFLLTGDSWFTALSIIIAVWIAFQWPSRVRFCTQFDLRGGERVRPAYFF